jgi:hypothetical protein
LKEAGLDEYFPETVSWKVILNQPQLLQYAEKQEVFPAASMDGFTAVRKILIQPGLRARQSHWFTIAPR